MRNFDTVYSEEKENSFDKPISSRRRKGIIKILFE